MAVLMSDLPVKLLTSGERGQPEPLQDVVYPLDALAEAVAPQVVRAAKLGHVAGKHNGVTVATHLDRRFMTALDLAGALGLPFDLAIGVHAEDDTAVHFG